MYIDKFEKIVIKIGSSILVDKKGKPKKIKKKIYTISALKHKGLTTIKRELVKYVH